MGKIFIYGQIGKEVDDKEIVKQILSETKDLEVHINSPGGDVYKGFSIYNALQKKRDILTTYIDGMAYSAASWLALAASPDKRFMSRISQFGIHQSMSFFQGNKDELKNQMDVLASIDEIQEFIYTESTGIDVKTIRAYMSNDKPLSFEQSKPFGFQEFQSAKIAALFNLTNKMDLKDVLDKLKGKGESTATLKEEVQAETKEILENADTAMEQLTAKFASAPAFLEAQKKQEENNEAIIAFLSELPTKKDIEGWIEAKSQEKLLLFADQFKTNGTIITRSELEETPVLEDKVAASFMEKVNQLNSKHN